jgi:hypothetical protein
MILKPLEPLGERPELIAVVVVLLLEPPCPDTQDRAASGDHVQRGHGLGQQRGVTVGVPGDQGRQLDGRGFPRQSPEGCVALQHRVVHCADARQLVEVIHHQDRIEAGCLRLARLGDHDLEQSVDRGVRVGEVRDLVAQTNAHTRSLIIPGAIASRNPGTAPRAVGGAGARVTSALFVAYRGRTLSRWLPDNLGSG